MQLARLQLVAGGGHQVIDSARVLPLDIGERDAGKSAGEVRAEQVGADIS